LPNRAFGTLHDPLPLPAYRRDRLESALRTAGLWPDSRAVVLCRPDAWGRVSFAATPVSIVGWIDDPDHSLASGMDVDVPHLHCLLVATPITVEGLDQLAAINYEDSSRRPHSVLAKRVILELEARS
jgi:hypothetical protein